MVLFTLPFHEMRIITTHLVATRWMFMWWEYNVLIDWMNCSISLCSSLLCLDVEEAEVYEALEAPPLVLKAGGWTEEKQRWSSRMRMEPGSHSHLFSSSSLSGNCLFPSEVSFALRKRTEEASRLGGGSLSRVFGVCVVTLSKEVSLTLFLSFLPFDSLWTDEWWWWVLQDLIKSHILE